MKKTKKIALNLNQVLIKKEVSKYRLAKLLKVETSHVTRWCNKSYNPTLKTINKIAEALNCSPLELLIENNEK